MIPFSNYSSVIYDANCIIYYCFKTEERAKNGSLVIIDEPPFTDITKKLTQYLIKKNIKICTILYIFEEVTKEKLSEVIKKRITDDKLRRELGLLRGEKFPEDIEFKLNRNINKKFKRMQFEPWFKVDKEYQPEQSLFKELKTFFIERKDSFGVKDVPSGNDMILILYSKSTISPLISNDGHICDFREDLKIKGYCHEIFPLKDCIAENLS